MLTEHRRAITRRVGHHLPRVLKHRDYTRFIVLSRARTGSNLLISLLDSHPGIDAQGEIVKRLAGREADAVISRIFGEQPFFTKATGFKIFYYHPLDDDSGRIWERLELDRDLAVIHLRRRNVLRAVVSRAIAEQRNVWLDLADAPSVGAGAKSVAISRTELEATFRQTRAWEADGDLRFANHRVLPVYYEDLVADTDATFSTVTDFLGVRFKRPWSGMQRQNPEPLRELLVGYDELRAGFQGTEWAKYFDE